mgnify:CR=1 FL=1
MNIENLIVNVLNYYQTDNMRLIGLMTWLIAWRAAYLLSKNSVHAFKAHVLYTISNVCLLIFNFSNSTYMGLNTYFRSIYFRSVC